MQRLGKKILKACQEMSIWTLVILILSYTTLAITIHNSPYLKQLEQWYRLQRLNTNLRCEGNATNWLAEVSKKAMLNPDYLSNISLAYISPNGELSTCVSGWYEHIGKGPLINNRSIYQFASVTKIITTDIILDLIRQEKLTLENKLVDILPELKNAKLKDDRVADIQVGHLLLHASGFDRGQLGIGDTMFSNEPWCPNNVAKLTNINLQFTPGTKTVYSNTGFCLLSRIAEEKYKLPFPQIAKKQYQFDKYQNLDFSISNDSLPQHNSAIHPTPDHYDHQSLTSVAGLYGNPSDFSTVVYLMNKKQYPTLLDRLPYLPCDTSKIRGCPVFIGYDYAPNENLHFYWRDGSMPAAASILVLDNQGGVLTISTNVRRLSSNTTALLEDVYQYRLQNEF